MNRLKEKSKILTLLVICLLVLLAVVHPARGREERAPDELPVISYLPIVGLNANRVPPLFGVQYYGSTLPAAKYTPFLLESQASWVRVPITWQSAEPVNSAPLDFNWAAIDSTLAIALRNSPKVIGTIDYAPDWAADDPQAPIYPSALPEFAQFVRALVERYDGDGLEDAPGRPVVTYWEFYNEPDATTTNWVPGWGEAGAQYAQMLRTVYPAIKQANRHAQVVFAGIAYDWWQDTGGPFVKSFLDDVLAAGAGPYFDVMNFHFYPSFSLNWTNDGSSGLYEKAQAIRAKLQSHQLDKPLIITETGWHSSNEVTAPSSPEMQARYVVELFVESMAADIDVMIWWTLYDPGGQFYANGLVSNDVSPVPKPSFTAYTTIVNRLGKADFVRRVPTPAAVVNQNGSVQSMDAYEFWNRATQRTVYVAWMNPINGGVTWPLRLPAAEATVHNLYNSGAYQVRDADDGAADGHVTVQVSSQPIYVEVP